VREADVSDGSRVPHGSPKHVKDLERRIADLLTWRNKQKRGSEARANYSRLISKLKGELASARRVSAKKTVSEASGDLTDDSEERERWAKLARGETPDDSLKSMVKQFQDASDVQTLATVRDKATQMMNNDMLSTVVTAGFIGYLFDQRMAQLNGPSEPGHRKLR
jgi:hypothetical protein